MTNLYRILSIILITWAGLTTRLWAQPSTVWQNVLEGTKLPSSVYSGTVVSVDLEPTSDGGSFLTSMSIFNSNPFVAKLNQNGEVQWSRIIYGGITVRGVQNRAGNYLVFRNTPQPFNVALTTLSPTGAVLSDRNLFTPSSDLERSLGFVVPARSGGYLVVVNEYDRRITPITLSTVLLRISDDGQLIWTRRLTEQGLAANILNASPSIEGDFLLIGFTNSPGVTGQPGQTNYYNWYFRVDDIGNVYSKYVDYNYRFGFLSDIKPTLDSNTPYISLMLSGSPGSHRLVVQLHNPDFSVNKSYSLSNSNYIQNGVSVQPTPDRGYLVVDAVNDNSGFANYRITKFDRNLNVLWQETGGGRQEDRAWKARLASNGTYLIAGSTSSPEFPGKTSPSSIMNVWVRSQLPFAVVPAYTCESSQLVVNTSLGNGSPFEYRVAGLRDWSTNNSFSVPPYQQNGTTFTLEVRQNGQMVSVPFTTTCQTIPPTSTPPTPPVPPTGQFVVLAPSYDCTMGRLTAQYSNGNGGLVEYRIVGNRDWGISPEFLIPPHQRQGTTFLVEARLNNGQTATVLFTSACGTVSPPTNPITPPSNPSVLGFSTPTVMCNNNGSGAQIQINLTGISPDPAKSIEYRVPGLADWQRSNAFNVPFYQATGTTFTLFARQNGVEISTTLTTNCQSSARIAQSESLMKWQAHLLSNPVDDQATISIRGAAGQTLDLVLTNLRGQRLETRQVVIENDQQEEQFTLSRQSAGVYLVKISSDKQMQTIKILRR